MQQFFIALFLTLHVAYRKDEEDINNKNILLHILYVALIAFFVAVILISKNCDK